MNNLEKLIKILLDELGEKIDIPENESEKFYLYKTLVNIRLPKEIDENYLNIDETVKTSPSKIFNSSNMIDDTITYTLGEKVKHAIYGIGVIVGIDDKILTIAFPYPHEIKKIMKGHKSITKLN